jgi:3D (Asp-Asp-Asp) domain-containing protein
MKKYLIIGCLCLWAASAQALDFGHKPAWVASATQKINRNARKASSTLLARVTVFWAKGGATDRMSRAHRAATGARLRRGVCAVDPRRIPYGSKVMLPDRTGLTAIDTGSAVKSRKAARLSGRTPQERAAVVVDQFFETRIEALAWANAHPLFCMVEVIVP